MGRVGIEVHNQRRPALSGRAIWHLQKLEAACKLTHRLKCEAANLAGRCCNPHTLPGPPQAATAPLRLSKTRHNPALILSRRGLH